MVLGYGLTDWMMRTRLTRVASPMRIFSWLVATEGQVKRYR